MCGGSFCNQAPHVAIKHVQLTAADTCAACSGGDRTLIHPVASASSERKFSLRSAPAPPPAQDVVYPVTNERAMKSLCRDQRPRPRRAQDVVYPVMNQRAMTYVGGGARDGQAWLDFLGTVKDARSPPAGSPFQIDFPAAPAPAGMAALAGALPACWDAALRCSCGDCPDGPQCAPVRGPCAPRMKRRPRAPGVGTGCACHTSEADCHWVCDETGCSAGASNDSGLHRWHLANTGHAG